MWIAGNNCNNRANLVRKNMMRMQSHADIYKWYLYFTYAIKNIVNSHMYTLIIIVNSNPQEGKSLLGNETLIALAEDT